MSSDSGFSVWVWMCLFHLVGLLTWCRAVDLRLIVWCNPKATNKYHFDFRVSCHYTRHVSSTDELNSEIGRINFHQSPSRGNGGWRLMGINATNWTTVLDYKPVVMSPAYYCGKKKSKRVGRPPGGHSNLEGGVKRRGRRRKRRKQLFVHKKRRSSASVDNTPAGSPQVRVLCAPCVFHPVPHWLFVFAWLFKWTPGCCLRLTGQRRGGGPGRGRLSDWGLRFRAPWRPPGRLGTVFREVAAHHAVSLPTSDAQAHAAATETSLAFVLRRWESPSVTKGKRDLGKVRVHFHSSVHGKMCFLI